VESAGLTLLSSLTLSRFWRLSKPPRSPTIRFESKEILGRTALDVTTGSELPQGRAVSQHPRRAACGASMRLMTLCRKFSAQCRKSVNSER
jgi:hypothetical protein